MWLWSIILPDYSIHNQNSHISTSRLPSDIDVNSEAISGLLEDLQVALFRLIHRSVQGIRYFWLSCFNPDSIRSFFVGLLTLFMWVLGVLRSFFHLCFSIFRGDFHISELLEPSHTRYKRWQEWEQHISSLLQSYLGTLEANRTSIQETSGLSIASGATFIVNAGTKDANPTEANPDQLWGTAYSELFSNGDAEVRLNPKGVRHEARNDAADELVLGERRGDEREPEVTSLRGVRPRCRHPLDGIKALDCLEGGLKERPSQWGEAHAPPGANKQLSAKLLLKLVDRLRDGLDGDALLLRGNGEIARACRAAEEHELSYVHGAPPMRVGRCS